MAEVMEKETNVVPQSVNTKSEELNKLFTAQKANTQEVKSTSAWQRIKKLKALKKHIFSNREAIQEAIHADFKKAALEVDITEIYPLVSEIRHTIDNLHDWMAEEKVSTPVAMMGSSSKIIYEAKGNSLLISPWNYPFYLAISPLVSAIAAGNTAILKPSEFTPNTTSYIKSFLSELFEENEVAVVSGDHTVACELLAMKFNHIHFTGSPMVGKIIMKAAAENLTSVTLELGGKSPAIVDASADIDSAAKRITWGKFINKGQTCIAPDYILVQEDKKDALINKIKENISGSYGDDIEGSDDYCRIVNGKHFKRIKGLLDDAIEKGAKIESGGNTNAEDNYIEPTVLSNVDDSMLIMQEEIFGPLLPILSFKDINEATEIVNSKERPLALYVFAKRDRQADFVINNTCAGGSCINDTIMHIAHPNLPFGGVNNSGIGKSSGLFGFREFSNARGVLKQHTSKSSTQMMYPPYTGMVKKVVDFTLKYF